MPFASYVFARCPFVLVNFAKGVDRRSSPGSKLQIPLFQTSSFDRSAFITNETALGRGGRLWAKRAGYTHAKGVRGGEVRDSL